jgi:6-phosphogluconolactonase
MSLLMQFRDRADAAEMVASAVMATLRAATAAHDAASVVVSGGESPRGLFRLLRTTRLPWEAVTIVPCDERWVAPDHADSNEGMIRRELLSGWPSDARFVSLYRPVAEADDGVGELAAKLAGVKRPFDTVLLGMGEDGHTASLFPDSPDIAGALRSEQDIIVQRTPRLSQARVSLTVRALLNAHEIHILFFGDAKRSVYRRALLKGPAEEFPVRAILHQDAVNVTAYWAP